MSNRNSQIDAIISDLRDGQERLNALSRSTTDQKWNKRNKPESWSIAECVEHLNMTSRAYLPLIRDAIATAPRHSHDKVQKQNFHRDSVGFLLSAMVGPLRKIGSSRIGRVKTTTEFEPKDHPSRQELLEEFEKRQIELMRLVDSSRQLPLDAIRIVSPFGGKMRYNVYSAYRILPRHQHRHLQQAEDVWPVSHGKSPAIT